MTDKKNKNSSEKRKSLQQYLTQQIFSFLIQQDRKKAYTWRQIASGAGVKDEITGSKFIKLLDELVNQGKLEIPETGKYRMSGKVVRAETGIIDITRDGLGFVEMEDTGEEIFVNASNLNYAMPGDKVKVKILRPAKGTNKAEGEVIEIIERARAHFVGTISIEGPFGILMPDNPKIPYDFLIREANLKGAKSGDKALIQIIKWTHQTPEAEVLRILGRSGENEAEMHAILYEFGFDPAFPLDVEEEAERIPKEISESEIRKRRDMRQTMTFTIDPVDAKDFDDALSFRELENGHYEIGIHIADVSHYLKPGTRMDDEAWRRATSVYLVDRTVPMLPEALSNFLCSLRPNEDKLCLSAVFEISPKGRIMEEWYGKTLIHSDRRFNYEEAQGYIDSGEGEYGRVLQIMNGIAKVFREERFKHGSIAIEEDEVKFRLDEKGKPIGLYRKVRVDSHKLIEDFMLLANRKVTEHVAKIRKENPLPFVYRIHDRPNEEKLATLKDFVKNFGYEIDLTSNQSIVQSLNKLMLGVEGKPEQHVVNSIAVRSMAKAIYSTTNIGHYGLGFKHYTHFTSPIRRYPDVMVHRLMEEYLSGHYSANPEKLERSCKHSSAMERKAAEAERASIKYKQVEYLGERIGETFDGLVSGVTSWGIYVEMVENKCEGMIRLSELDDDFYEYDEKNYCVRGRRTGYEIYLGDKVVVEIRSANLEKRVIDLNLLDHEPKAFAGKRKPSGSAEPRRGKKAFDRSREKKGGKAKKRKR